MAYPLVTSVARAPAGLTPSGREAVGEADAYDPAVALGVDGVRVGVWTHASHPTGCTVILPPEGTVGGAAVRGGAPGSRETAALSPTGSVQVCHAILLTGGSAFGLGAADGVMGWCEEHGIGLVLPTATVPIVGAAVVFDLREPGRPRPDAAAGRAACEGATADDPPQGSVGVGAGCTAGKAAGRDFAVSGGQGWAVARSGEVVVGALMAVNPLGDVIDERGGVLAGTRAPADAPRFPAATLEEVGAWGIARQAASAGGAQAGIGNTVIGCLVTNARLSKTDVCRAADLSHSGIARAVSPAHTSVDGDILFLLATGGVDASMDLVADLGANAVAAAIRSAVRHATKTDGVPADPRARRH